jgi:hypothetical protein
MPRPIVATRPAPAAVLVQEDPAIIALGEKIDPLLATYRGAAADRPKARANAEASCSAIPAELVCNEVYWAGCTDSERDVEGKEIVPPAVVGEFPPRPRRILHSESTKAVIAAGARDDSSGLRSRNPSRG